MCFLALLHCTYIARSCEIPAVGAKHVHDAALVYITLLLTSTVRTRVHGLGIEVRCFGHIH